ncbi:MAG: hypothetical protein Q8Q50_01710 [Methylobacter sp.]|jgi:hypothetical protein|nr:hypothetical protein [Methylobacter sp.]
MTYSAFSSDFDNTFTASGAWERDILTQADANKALAGLNHRSRKALNHKTPWEVFCKMAGLDTGNLLGVAFMG